MSETAMFVGWGGTHPGRERFAQRHFAEFLEILEELQAKGEIERFETVLLGPHGGGLDGFVLVYAPPETLAAMQTREDLHRLQSRAMLDHATFGVVMAAVGPAVEREVALKAEALTEYEREPVLA